MTTGARAISFIIDAVDAHRCASAKIGACPTLIKIHFSSIFGFEIYKDTLWKIIDWKNTNWKNTNRKDTLRKNTVWKNTLC